MSDFKKFCIDEKLSPVQIVGARKAWQEQQAKIDELQKENAALVHVIKSRDIQEKNELTKQRDSFIKAYEIEMDESVELQKRVDAALKILSSKKKMYVDMVIEVEQALKGGEACQ